MTAKIFQKELTLHTQIDQRYQTTGVDNFWKCRNKLHYLKYPYKVECKFNSRGFRDDEWPDSEDKLRNAIWCVGDSFTVGVGSPIDHTWPKMLAQATGRRTINVSMTGASNNWMVRQIEFIEKNYSPKNIIVMWSYWHRREKNDPFLLDENRRIHSDQLNTASDDLENFLNCQKQVKSTVGEKLTQLIVPNFTCGLFSAVNKWQQVRGYDWPVCPPETLVDFMSLPAEILKELIHWDLYKKYISFYEYLNNTETRFDFVEEIMSSLIEFSTLDLAKDGIHFDKKTSQWIVQQIMDHLS